MKTKSKFMVHAVTASGREYDSVWTQVDDPEWKPEWVFGWLEDGENRWITFTAISGAEVALNSRHVESIEVHTWEQVVPEPVAGAEVPA